MFRPSALCSAAALLASCETYTPEPLDPAAHLAGWARRTPDGPEVAAFVRGLATPEGAPLRFDATDGLDRHEAALVALVFNPELRAARARAGIAAASAAEAGRLPDPELRLDLLRILTDVANPWIAAAQLGIPLPLTGRQGLEQSAASAGQAVALAEAREAEARVLAELDARWVEWSATRTRLTLLDELLRHLAEIGAIAERLRAAGEISALDARVFALEQATRQAEQITLQARASEDELALRALLGLSPDALLALRPEPAPLPEAPADPQALEQNPRLSVRRLQHDQAERRLALEVRKQWPELTLWPTFEHEDGDPRAGFGLSLPLPILDGNRKAIAEAAAARTAARVAYEAEREHLGHELAVARSQLAAAAARRQLFAERVAPLVDQQLQEARQLASRGELATLLLLDSLVRAFDARSRALDAWRDEALARVRLCSLFPPALPLGPKEMP